MTQNCCHLRLGRLRIGRAADLRHHARVLIVISGLPGTGKSAVAVAVAEHLHAVYLSVDPVEDALLGAGLPAGWTTGVAAYEAVRVAAEANMTFGWDVVVDAVNDSEIARQTWRTASMNTGVPLTFILLAVTDVSEHRRRVEGRNRNFAKVSDPTWEQVQARAQAYEAWLGEYEVVNADGAIADVVEAVLARLGG